MILYRLQSYPGTDDWANEWHPTAEDGKRALRKATESELPARLEKIDVPTGREGMCEFLNTADANHMNQRVIELVGKNY